MCVCMCGRGGGGGLQTHGFEEIRKNVWQIIKQGGLNNSALLTRTHTHILQKHYQSGYWIRESQLWRFLARLKMSLSDRGNSSTNLVYNTNTAVSVNIMVKSNRLFLSIDRKQHGFLAKWFEDNVRSFIP